MTNNLAPLEPLRRPNVGPVSWPCDYRAANAEWRCRQQDALEAAAVWMPWLWPLAIARRVFVGGGNDNRNHQFTQEK